MLLLFGDIPPIEGHARLQATPDHLQPRSFGGGWTPDLSEMTTVRGNSGLGPRPSRGDAGVALDARTISEITPAQGTSSLGTRGTSYPCGCHDNGHSNYPTIESNLSLK
eukprot:828408-Pyramimonas_sp.AAC.1